MLLQHKFDDTEMNLALELFLRECVDCFGDQLVSVVLYGSLVYDDLSPGYSDLDFLAVVKDDIPEAMYSRVSDMRKPLRSGHYGVLATMIEGEFVPRKSLASPEIGQSYYWGTSSDKPRPGSSVRGLVAECIHQRGVTIWGESITSEIPRPTREEILQDLRDSMPGIREHGRGGGLHSVDFLLTIARFLIIIRENRLSSKSEAADWGRVNAKGAWREHLPMAKQVRLNPALADSPETKAWLESLTAPIQEACAELEQELEHPTIV
ncbi:MAG: DUF4111 domain-containing protein [Armatimonadetes bacterium]|nr:DUF4111 domain-containing protein [Armatimonadota bacterium]